MAEELIPAALLAAELHRSVTTLRNWRRAGAGPRWVRIRGRVMYPRAQVDAWLSRLQQHASKEYEQTEQEQEKN